MTATPDRDLAAYLAATPAAHARTADVNARLAAALDRAAVVVEATRAAIEQENPR